MRIPQLKESCCGCSLQTGSKIIGWFHLVVSLIALILVALNLAVGRHIRIETPNGTIYVENAAFGYLVATIIGVIIAIIISILLLLGAYNRHSGQVLTWVIYNTITTIIFLVGTLYGSGMMLAAGHTGPGLGNLFGGLIALVIQCYLLIVVYSFYRELKHGPQNVATYNSA